MILHSSATPLMLQLPFSLLISLVLEESKFWHLQQRVRDVEMKSQNL